MTICWRVTLFGAGLVILAMATFGVLVYWLVSANNPAPDQVAGLRSFLILSGVVIFVVALALLMASHHLINFVYNLTHDKHDVSPATS